MAYPPPVPAGRGPVPPHARREILRGQVATQVQHGATVVAHYDFEAILASGQRPNHLLHFFITFFTCGLWAIVWIFLSITNRERRWRVWVDEAGRIGMS